MDKLDSVPFTTDRDLKVGDPIYFPSLPYEDCTLCAVTLRANEECKAFQKTTGVVEQCTMLKASL